MPKKSNVAAPTEEAAVWVPIDTLIPWSKNPRKNELAIAGVADSIKRFGFGSPIVARRADNVIIGGHTRLQAAQRLGLGHVPVRYLDVDEVDAKLLSLADNKLGEVAEWDDAVLAQVLEELKADGAELSASGFSDAEIAAILAEADAARFAGVEEADVPLPPKTPTSVPGEIYELGPHRLLCGDSTSLEDVERLCDGVLVDLLWTDPPYNVAYVGKTKDALTIQNDEMDGGQFRQFLRDAFTSASTVMRDGAAFYIAHADSEGENFRGAARETGWKLAQCLIWVKDQFVMGRQDYHWRHEPILYGWKEGAAHHALEDRTQDTIWEFPRPRRNAEHPTMKPVELVQRAIENSSDAGAVVLDLFGGSGSTLIAAARCGRRAFLVEKDPAYCDVIRQRWEQFAPAGR